MTRSFATTKGGVDVGDSVGGACTTGIFFADASGNLAQDCTNLTYDGLNLYLGQPLILDNILGGDIYTVYRDVGNLVGTVGWQASQFGMLDFNGFNIAVYDIGSSSYFFGNGNVVVDQNTFTVGIGGSGGISVDTNGNILFLNTAPLGINNQGVLLDSAGNDSVDWANYRLLAGSTIIADWGAQYLSDGGGDTSLDWSNRLLLDGAATPSLDWESRLGIDSANTNSFDWNNRVLYDAAQVASANWDARSLFTSSGTIAIQWDTGGVINYNGIATVSNGVPAEYATVDLTTQGAAIAATTAYAVPSTGLALYRISWVATITRAATTSSVLGGTNGFQIVYTDGNDSVVKTSVAGNSPTSAANTTGTSISGTLLAYCKASTNLQYKIDYTSVGVTTMQYNLHVKVEKL